MGDALGAEEPRALAGALGWVPQHPEPPQTVVFQGPVSETLAPAGSVGSPGVRQISRQPQSAKAGGPGAQRHPVSLSGGRE